MRFLILGVGLMFAGFLMFGIFGNEYRDANLEMLEFNDCFEYTDETGPVQVNCTYKIFDQTIFLVVVGALLLGGTISLIKGIRGKWDNEVKPEDMVGPGNSENSENKDN
ncbi:MAG: hypothetical protein KC483_01815 [Nitrosarchaeum sp.]|nr:hypothetical protein [Nitrosarchaeum sp.]MCA9820195.1 hypothetical protein [Nitrosarchaeum sp.]